MKAAVTGSSNNILQTIIQKNYPAANYFTPPVLDELLAADASERDLVAAVRLVQAIAGWDDPRVITALTRRLQDPAAAVELQAAYELTLPSISATHHQAVLATVPRLLDYHAPTDDEWHTVGLHAHEVLYRDVQGPYADALIARDLDRPDPPTPPEGELVHRPGSSSDDVRAESLVISNVQHIEDHAYYRYDVLEISPRINAICVLVQRDYAPALRLADAALTPLPTDSTPTWSLLYALGQSSLPDAEPMLVRVLTDPATNATARFQASWSLGMASEKHPFGAPAITALIATCLAAESSTRSQVRRYLDRQKLTPEQTKSFNVAVQQATKRFGDQAFPNYRPPKPPEPPPPPPVKSGTDDF